MRLLIDECLSSALVAVAKAKGVPAVYSAHIGLSGWQDWNLVQFAFASDYVIVTNNRRDFLKEYLKQEVHNGLVVIIPNVGRNSQVELFSRLLDYLSAMNDLPVNRLIEILEDGTIHIREWSSEGYDPEHIDNPSWRQE